MDFDDEMLGTSDHKTIQCVVVPDEDEEYSEGGPESESQ